MKAVSITRPKRAITLVAILALGLFLVLAPKSYASTGPGHRAQPTAAMPRTPGLTRHMYALMMAQTPLDQAATRIQEAAAKPGPGHGGFFETAVNDATRTLTVLWHGRVPADIRNLIQRLNRSVHIRVVHTRYSLGTLNSAVRQALRTDRAVVGGYPLNNGGGIHLDIRAASTSRARTAATAIQSRLGLPVIAEASGGIRLQATCTFAPNDTKGAGSRCWDLPAFWGGDVIQSVYAGCSGGFGVHDANGNTYLATAAHCAVTPNGYENGVSFNNGNNTATVGKITDVPGPHDWAVIPTSAGNRYYDGPGIYAGDTYNTKHVAGQQGTSVGDWLCESGAFGGVVCAMQVTALNYAQDGWYDMALARTASGVYSIDGDSGGPWFSLDGSSSVWAKGIHHGVKLDIYGNPIGEVFTPIFVMTNDAGFWVNT